MTIGERIKKTRLAKGMTQKQLAEKCGTYDSAIRKYESGRTSPNAETVYRIAVALEEDPSTFYASDGYTPVFPALKKGGEIIKVRDKQQKELLALYRLLNLSGKREALKRVTELTELERYTKIEKEDLEEWDDWFEELEKMFQDMDEKRIKAQIEAERAELKSKIINETRDTLQQGKSSVIFPPIIDEQIAAYLQHEVQLAEFRSKESFEREDRDAIARQAFTNLFDEVNDELNKPQ